MNTRVWWSAGLGLMVAVMLVSGCASTGTSAMPLPPAKMLQTADLASLAGEWQGTLRAAAGTGPVGAGRSAVGRVTVAPDWAYTSNVDGAPGAGKARIEGGGDGRRVLKGEGTWVGFPGNAEFELAKR